ncbi:MAG: hypothetical protein NUW37_14460 [Planctomycetes bacterium]|nr:hypothetical protein [Planctomycetota bacterium]
MAMPKDEGMQVKEATAKVDAKALPEIAVPQFLYGFHPALLIAIYFGFLLSYHDESESTQDSVLSTEQTAEGKELPELKEFGPESTMYVIRDEIIRLEGELSDARYTDEQRDTIAAHALKLVSLIEDKFKDPRDLSTAQYHRALIYRRIPKLDVALREYARYLKNFAGVSRNTESTARSKFDELVNLSGLGVGDAEKLLENPDADVIAAGAPGFWLEAKYQIVIRNTKSDDVERVKQLEALFDEARKSFGLELDLAKLLADEKVPMMSMDIIDLYAASLSKESVSRYHDSLFVYEAMLETVRAHKSQADGIDPLSEEVVYVDFGDDKYDRLPKVDAKSLAALEPVLESRIERVSVLVWRQDVYRLTLLVACGSLLILCLLIPARGYKLGHFGFSIKMLVPWLIMFGGFYFIQAEYVEQGENSLFFLDDFKDFSVFLFFPMLVLFFLCAGQRLKVEQGRDPNRFLSTSLILMVTIATTIMYLYQFDKFPFFLV